MEELENGAKNAENGNEEEDSGACTHVLNINEGDLGLAEGRAKVLIRLTLQIVRVLFDLIRHQDLLRSHIDGS